MSQYLSDSSELSVTEDTKQDEHVVEAKAVPSVDIPTKSRPSILKRFVRRSRWTPPWCRQQPGREFGYNPSIVLLSAFASAVAAANLYYTYPVLNKAADDFGISYERAALIPQLLQGGYGIGILFLCPLGDVFRLRPLILTLTVATTCTWLGLCLASNFEVFTTLSFFTGFVTVSPQLLLPLIGTLAPPERRATAVSLVLAGMMMGLALPRVVAGIVTQYTPWRNIYWAALGLQCILVALMWLFLPDYPRPDPDNTQTFSRKYFNILGSIIRMTLTEPILAYGCLVTFLVNAVQASFWTTLTAHLAGQPFNFGPLNIGLFSMIGIGTTILIPVYAHFVIERFAPYFATTNGLLLTIVTVAVDCFTGDVLGIGGPILQAFGVDFGVQLGSVAYRAAVYKELPANRANVIFTACAFIGQLVGTSVGNTVYARGGWSNVGMFHIAFSLVTMMVIYLRGPREKRWFGWTGGPGLRLENGGAEKKDESSETEKNSTHV
ncbi:major facilitator superfamily domain-containing protein [Apiosordaria backusii]|uniref:Major facilitator superfamily domain-containing protein n=1 Tax=Apiosordaria backusii TaxID=314023 RepID=A0AA40EXZ4_9PEZI|nr:major facilitator superfamily domain-containing protein [Apiosordaria backusii]